MLANDWADEDAPQEYDDEMLPEDPMRFLVALGSVLGAVVGFGLWMVT
jgi:hypothetical protein